MIIFTSNLHWILCVWLQIADIVLEHAVQNLVFHWLIEKAFTLNCFRKVWERNKNMNYVRQCRFHESFSAAFMSHVSLKRNACSPHLSPRADVRDILVWCRFGLSPKVVANSRECMRNSGGSPSRLEVHQALWWAIMVCLGEKNGREEKSTRKFEMRNSSNNSERIVNNEETAAKTYINVFTALLQNEHIKVL